MEIMVGSPVSGDNFFGRERELEMFWNRVPHGNLLLAAPRRAGKTSLMHRMKEAPQHGFECIFVDVEHEEHPAGFIAALFDGLRRHQSTGGFRELLKRFSKNLTLEPTLEFSGFKLQFAKAMSKEGTWKSYADELFGELRKHSEKHKFLIMIDEFPVFIQTMLRKGGSHHDDAEMLLHWFRSLRISPEMTRGNVRFLVTGSIGLEGLARRFGLSRTINDLETMTLPPFNREKADGLLVKLGAASGGRVLSAELRHALLERLSDTTPYFIQLFFKELCEYSLTHEVEPSEELIEKVYHERLVGTGGNKVLSQYNERLDLIFDIAEAKSVRALLKKIASVENGLSENRVNSLIKKAELADPEACDRILEILNHDGYLRLADGVWRFQSGLLKDWWKKVRPVATYRRPS